MKRITLTAVLVALLIPVAATAAPASSIDKRTRAVVYLVKKCGQGVTLALTVAQGGSSVQASEAVNTVKSACDTYSGQILDMPTGGGMSGILDDAFGALDYWKRGLGRISDYIDNNKASDYVTAKQYLSLGQAYWIRTHREVNALRVRKGLPRI
jgi:hypothetical protein